MQHHRPAFDTRSHRSRKQGHGGYLIGERTLAAPDEALSSSRCTPYATTSITSLAPTTNSWTLLAPSADRMEHNVPGYRKAYLFPGEERRRKQS
jgi:hypothetical protein